MSHISMLKTILHQAHQKRADILEITLLIYHRKEPFKETNDEAYWSISELDDMITALAIRCPIVCVLDGLDDSEAGETSGESRSSLITKLASLTVGRPTS